MQPPEARQKEKEAAERAEKKKAREPVRVDLQGIQDRIVPFPAAPTNARGLQVAKGKVYWLSFPTAELPDAFPPPPRKGAIQVLDLEKRKAAELLAGVERYDVSADGSRILYKSDKTWGIAEPKEGLKPGDGALKLDGLRMELDARAEWRQIFHETWRLYRDFFYLADMGEVDWPAMRSRYEPLLPHPGVKVAAGEYLLAIDGQELTAGDEPYRLLAQTPGRTVSLTVSARPSRQGAREVAVQPLHDERDLRYFDWVESNRRKVDQATGGRAGYVHIPDMGGRGLTEFIRQYYSQVDRDGLIVDVRANGGGFVSAAILERLRRRVVGMSGFRGERPDTYPKAALHGPVVAIADQYSGSDGDIFPWFFREYGLGPVVGERTWGGVVGIRELYSGMVDGGYAFVAEMGIYDTQGRWIIENQGVVPDIEVDNLPADVLPGRDPQLERAIAEVMKRIEAEKPKLAPPPPSKDLRRPGP